MLNKIKMGPKLIGGFGIVALIAGITGYVGYFGVLQLGNNFKEVTDVRVPSIEAIEELTVAKDEVLVVERGLMIDKMIADPKVREAQYTFLYNSLKKADEAWKLYDPLSKSAEEAKLWKDFGPIWNEWMKQDENYITIMKERDSLMDQGASSEKISRIEGKGLIQMLKAREEWLKVTEGLKGLLAENRKIVSESRTEAYAAISRSKLQVLIILVIGVLFAFGIGYFLTRSIVGPMQKGVKMIKEIGMGHLSARLKMTRKDEIGELATTMDQFADDLQNIVVATMNKIADGDVSTEIALKDDKDEIAPALERLTKNIRALIAEATMLSKAAVAGQLQTRGNASKYKGGYKDIVQGVNDCLDAVLKPIEEAAGVLEQVAKKDMSARMKGDYQGDHAKIKVSLNAAVDNLDKGLQQVRVASEQVASASGQISTGSQTIAQGASEQASTLEEISSNLQEMSAMTKQNAGNAKEARGISETAKTSVQRGVDSMKKMSDAIEKIKVSSDSTAKIIKTIDEIAFQTNLLALNAAVEAARAGDAGKGFAVVAEEVRNLAMRSAEAAKNTARMIEESVQNSENGVQINAEVLKNFTEINDLVVRVNTVMGEISAASDQQTIGIDQITIAVDQMNQATQQSAANSEESASAAEELTGQSEEMNSLVRQYKLTLQGGSENRHEIKKHELKVVDSKQVAKKVEYKKNDAKTLIPMEEDKKALSSF